MTLHQAKVAAQKVFAARLDGRDPAAEKRESKRRIVVDCFALLLEEFIDQRLVQKRSGSEIGRVLRPEFGQQWAGTSIHAIKKRDVVDVVSAIEQRGAPAAAIKALKSIKTFFNWESAVLYWSNRQLPASRCRPKPFPEIGYYR